QKPKDKIIIIDFEYSNYQLTDLILISVAISQTHRFVTKLFEKKPDQLQVILNELHLAMKTKTSNLTGVAAW
ncbi:Uncharacterized protein FWK35_00024540, partial [Aphis craccivora]